MAPPNTHSRKSIRPGKLLLKQFAPGDLRTNLQNLCEGQANHY
jgi:hypothetical protein